MTLKLYNTLTRSLCDFRPLKDGEAGVYVCGPTVYDDAHIGHARAAVAFDILVRHLAASGHDVKYVRNFTDVDDKIIARAREKGVHWKDLAEGYIASFNEDMDALGCLRPTFAPRATEYISQMQEDIQGIMDAGHAYALDGDVYFDVDSLPSYGTLSRREPQDTAPGARVAVDGRKRNPADFALWKAAADGDPSWPSPWGPGRPGWHIECSAMSARLLGPAFDIHGGGQDLVFPHHENEMAQSAALGRTMAVVWIHNGFVNVNSEKMSKSLGNALGVKEILRRFPPEAVRFFLLSSHYRGPVDFSDEAVGEALRALERLYRAVEAADALGTPSGAGGSSGQSAGEALAEAEALRSRFREALNDDLNTSLALGALFEAARLLNRRVAELDAAAAAPLREAAVSMGAWLGMDLADHAGFFGRLAALKESKGSLPARELIEERIGLRNEARARKDWTEADRIRKELTDMGVILEDKSGGTSWRYA